MCCVGGATYGVRKYGRVVWHLLDRPQPSFFEVVLPTGRWWYRRVVWNFPERPRIMLLANIIRLGMLCKKLAGVKDGEIVKKSRTRGLGELCGMSPTDLNPGNVVGKYELVRCFVWKDGTGRSLSNCEKNHVFKGYPHMKKDVQEDCVKLFWHTLTVAMFLENMNKLSILCETLAWGRRLCNCEEVILGEWYPRRGEVREDCVNFVNRPKSQLCGWQIWNGWVCCVNDHFQVSWIFDIRTIFV